MLKIPREDFEKIIDLCRREFPREACGLIAGVKRNGISYVRKIYPLRNIAKSPFMYEADAEELYNAFMSIDRDGLDFLGIYHSHPFGRAEPSELDRRCAFYPNVVYVIISLEGGRVYDVKTYLWNGQEFVECGFSVEA
jgi:proteasome lid subunit RPN8/RPN11